ncbi:classical protein kinase C [Cryptococcus neoformans C23]|uniref:protein kinase C n=3 Tax=Cryptococcus neoformans TaxID=5207 RepID=A0A854QNY8_CRYNE|nr:AGC/PKC protein kinase [Cryptococcus neoformans var. grubii H99]AAQ84895.1 protein kinase C 1 [Cryptococcus neoformans var. grubii]OWZ30776.1 classical protein kinase C [Cryptococcus neoformans var. grubii AD1-83a]OWZ46647.1 classical protein kinase C [Cryptococcus neoformans var. grubii C23]OWZ55770.1 classical protein kinase C [Cryptococcus neoformans var. grubii 125.91]OXC81874.1 classical protein kinase C [Cryptococcus neoformans var. grubii AD1-7a]OXG25915.1 classical protein kinase C|eukprot:XP_012052800.1 AGC/PKC protein kinase [Cryptococcus neoformans var. grubii H99]
MASNDPKAKVILQSIATEKRNIEGARAVIRAFEASSKNETVIQQAQNEIRTATMSIKFLEDELAKLQVDGSGASSGTPGRGEPSGRAGAGVPGRQGPQGIATTSPGGRGMAGDRERPLPPPPPGAEQDNAKKPETKNYSQLDLLRYDAPLTGAKITRMLNQLQFKLQVEEQYRTGIEKMAQAYRAEGDKRLKSETDAKKSESEGKIQLLRKAKKRYESLAKFGGAVEDDEDLMSDGKRKEALRKPISGKLVISLRSARDLNHRTLPRRSSKTYSETTVIIKVEGNERAVSHPSRNDKWHEDFHIPVEKANEVEITIYDTVAPGDSAPIGMLWLRVSDLVEALRRQKVGIEGQGAGWVTAATAATMGPRSSGNAPDSVTLHSAGTLRGRPDAEGKGPDGIDGWWSVEPAGAISLRMDFVKDTVAGARRPYEALGRQGAVRMRKGDVYEMNGHKFVQRQFYQPIMCALCQEFLLTGEGYQCEDCRYACHKKCYPKVVTKCISKSNADGEGDEEKINHRIPHRFTSYTNMSANWCCHCGYMLPFGRKNAVKCSECALTCHQTCSHLVPDFCGMTMEMANLLLKNLRDIKTTQHRKPVPSTSTSSSVSTLPSYHSQEARSHPVQSAAPQQPALSPHPPAGTLPSADQRPIQPQAQNQQTGAYDNLRPAGGRAMPQLPPVAVPSSKISFEGERPQEPHAQIHPVMPSAQPQPQTLPPSAQSVQPPVKPHYVPQPPVQQQVTQRLPPQQPVMTRKRKVGLDDFNFLAVLGKGNFGKVMLAEEKTSSNLYAIKVLKKEFIIENDEVESTQSEKRVFLAAAQERHPFLLGLHSCFQTETRVYFVMEYISGGDLMLHIQKKQFTLRQAKFYACEVLLALQYFHSKGIIYRDLKLDNILLTLDGHVKVADYGLCKEEMWFGKTTSTFCGTPEFMAPEILLEQRYGRAVDWWAFGVLTYEMLLGQSPFRGEDEDEIFDAILEDEPLYPITMPRDAVSLLQRLLTRDPTRRLGAGEGDAEEIKQHLFFRDVNFDDVYHKRIPPPYFPVIGNATDTSNFDQEFTREQPTLTPVHTQLSEADQKEFAGFSWIAPWAAAQA